MHAPTITSRDHRDRTAGQAPPDEARCCPVDPAALARRRRFLGIGLFALGAWGIPLVSAAAERPAGERNPRLVLHLTEGTGGQLTPARFSLTVDGRTYEPEEINEHGLRFVSVHESKRQTQVVTYARGTGPVELPLPAGSRRVVVHVAKGLEFRPVAVAAEVTPGGARADISLARWADLAADGWFAADEHVHYDRLDPADNRDWLTMMAADGLSHAHFMMLKGGKVPGEWGRQYAYGRAGEAGDGARLITPGEEYRDSAQGHLNLLGVGEVIPPVMTGTGNSPNYPLLFPVLLRARELGAFNGVAHGASLGRNTTAIVDTVMGGVDFFEIANTHLFAPELWYQLLGAGFHLPPAAGTDLPNYPFRDAWQPFLGGMRMYVRSGDARDFAGWRAAVERGAVFITAGPLLAFTVDGQPAGETIRLPAGGGEVEVAAELSSPLGLQRFELIVNGQPAAAELEKRQVDGVTRWRLRQRLRVDHSSWLAVRGAGVPIEVLRRLPELKALAAPCTEAIAHSAAVRVLVGGQPVRLAPDLAALIATLARQREFYRTQARYARGEHRDEMLALFDAAIAGLAARRREAEMR